MTFDLSVEEAVARIEARESLLSAFISTRLPEALAEARARGREGPLANVPYSLKDEWETLALPTTGGSFRYRDRRSPSDSPVHQVFAKAGGILLGKSNLSDLGLVPEASSWVGGETKNPRGLDRTPGGSSGGAAAAVADRMVAFDWGTDVGGSIRIPAGFTGIYGLRLATENWPIEGMFPAMPPALAWMCAQGPLTRTLPEMRAVLEAAAPLRRGALPSFGAERASIVLPGSLGQWPTVRRDLEDVAAKLALPLVDAEAIPSSNHVKFAYAGVWASHLFDLMAEDPDLSFLSGLSGALSGAILRGRGLFGGEGDKRFYPLTAETLLLVALGRFTLFWSKQAALRRAHAIRDAARRLFDRRTVLLMPVCTVPAPKIGRTNRTSEVLESCILGNLIDAAAIAVPFGTFPDGLPRALQILGPAGSEAHLLDLADRLR